jgi:hypothetical protein
MAIIRKSGNGQESMRNIQNLPDKITGQMGWDKSAVYENGTSVAYIAAIQEFGSPKNGIPSRSYFRSTIKEKKKSWGELMYKLLKNKKMNVLDAFETMVQTAEGDVVKTISTLESPALKESTIRARLRRRSDKITRGKLDKPLIDTGYMLSTFTSKVNK